MKKAVLSLALFAAFSGAANAAIVNVGSVTAPSLGNPLSSVTAAGLNQVYFFNLTNTAGSLSASFNSDPIDTSMIGKFYTSDAAGNLGTLLTNFGANSQGNVTLSYGAITSGYYAFQFTSPSASQVTYSGQFSARVPAPAALGLAGLGLVGLGLFSRRRAV
jgi:hypothetical protein